jgi:hypothetical protein
MFSSAYIIQLQGLRALVADKKISLEVIQELLSLRIIEEQGNGREGGGGKMDVDNDVE